MWISDVPIVLSTCALVVWVYSCLPSSHRSFPASSSTLTLLITDIDLLSEKIPQSDSFPPDLKKSTLEIATKNLVCSVALTGVMLLQAGRQTSENKDTSADPLLIKTVKMDTSAVDDEPTHISGLDAPVMPRGRRRSHHDHLEADLDNASMSSSTSSMPSDSASLKRDGSRRKRRPLTGSNKNKPMSRTSETSVSKV